ncbi:MAG: hypothetical protein AB8H79_21935 [Myxococcota bacterium]
MASLRDTVADVFSDGVRRADRSSIRALYAAVSVPVARERARLRRTGRPFLDPEAPTPDLDQVRQTATRMVEQATFSATALGGIAGMGGAVSVPPEVMATLVGVVRLAQRLAIVYGLNPDTDRGQLAVQQALSSGLQIDLPTGGPMGLKISDLPGVFARSAPKEVTVAMTRAVVRQTAWMVVGSIGRFIPVISAGAGAVGGRRRMREVGHRMREALERLAELPLQEGTVIVDAVEVQGR